MSRQKVKIFDERVDKRFAWFPTLLDDGNEVWFKHYYVNQYFGDRYANDPRTKEANPRLSDNEWVDVYSYTK